MSQLAHSSARYSRVAHHGEEGRELRGRHERRRGCAQHGHGRAGHLEGGASLEGEGASLVPAPQRVVLGAQHVGDVREFVELCLEVLDVGLLALAALVGVEG